MPTYRVTYAHADGDEDDETTKHGYATQEVETDHAITTQDDIMEIARQIGRESNYVKVAILKTELKIEPDDTKDEDDAELA